METQEITFNNSKAQNSLCNFHNKGGELYDGMPLLFERNYRTPLIDCILKSWVIGEVKMDITGFGKFSVSNCNVEINGKIETIPFTMLYIKK